MPGRSLCPRQSHLFSLYGAGFKGAVVHSERMPAQLGLLWNVVTLNWQPIDDRGTGCTRSGHEVTASPS